MNATPSSGSAISGAAQLCVVSHRGWVADDFERGAVRRPGVRVTRSLGLDIPVLDRSGACFAYWAPVEWLARAATPLAQRGTPLTLSGPRPELLMHPAWAPHLGRRVEAAWLSTWQNRVAAGALTLGPGWWKPATMKLNDLPAQYAEDPAVFLAASADHGLEWGSWLQWSEPLTGPSAIAEEHRFFVLHGEPVTGSVYLRNHGEDQVLWHENMTSENDRAALAAAQRMTSEIGGDQPPAYVLDLALLADGRWVIVEANPAFSAGIYGCDPAAALDVVLAANNPRTGASKWRWRFDPHLTARAKAQRPLRIQTIGPAGPATDTEG